MTRPAGGRTVVRRLVVRDFRNIERAELELASRFNLIFGDNGHGKTSLIEALYVLATTRSFRCQKLGETVREGSDGAQLACAVDSFGLQRSLRAALSGRGRSFAIDGKRPKRYLDYAMKTPVIAFHPGELTLASGPAAGRRTLLDRIMLHQDPAGADARLSYQKAMRKRQKILDDQGERCIQLDAYEQVIASHGARLCQGRRNAAEALIESLAPAFTRMAPAGLSCETSYEPGGTIDVEEFERQLRERRLKDKYRGAATFGPQRDEISFRVDGRPARSHASQGQQRLLTLAMKLAELSCVREVTGSEPILLLDDVSSELDPKRTASVFDLLSQSESQVFVTTTRPELFSEVASGAAERAEFEVRDGVVSKSKI